MCLASECPEFLKTSDKEDFFQIPGRLKIYVKSLGSGFIHTI